MFTSCQTCIYSTPMDLFSSNLCPLSFLIFISSLQTHTTNPHRPSKSPRLLHHEPPSQLHEPQAIYTSYHEPTPSSALKQASITRFEPPCGGCWEKNFIVFASLDQVLINHEVWLDGPPFPVRVPRWWNFREEKVMQKRGEGNEK